MSEFAGQRWAIDISVFLYKFIRSAGPGRWMNSFVLMLCMLRKYGIKAVCIFDGPDPPKEKKKEQNRRRAQAAKSVSRMKESIRIRNTLQDDYLFYDTPPPQRLLDEAKINIGTRKGYSDTTNYHDTSDVIEALNTVIERLEKQTMPIVDEYRELAMEIVDILGLVGIRAPGEAEAMCSYLAVKGHVDAVLTEDTDVLAYGTPVMVAFKDFSFRDEKVTYIVHSSLTESLGYTPEEFRDLCILLSCDYNKRIKVRLPGKKKYAAVGFKKAMALMTEYRTLEAVCEYAEDDAPLKYERCRELFSVPRKIPGGYVPLNRPPNIERLDKFISEHGMTVKIEYILEHYRPPEIILEMSDD